MSDSLTLTLDKIRRRDEDAIAELVQAHHRPLRGYVAALCANIDAADDLAQEVFLRALERLERIQDLEDFPRFLRGIARNVVREQSRRYARNSERYVEFIDEAFAAEDTAPADSPLRDPNVVGALRRCMEKLPSKSRKMLTLRYSDEQRAEEIGRALGMNGGAVRTSLLRVREALLKCLRGAVGTELSEAGL